MPFSDHFLARGSEINRPYIDYTHTHTQSCWLCDVACSCSIKRKKSCKTANRAVVGPEKDLSKEKKKKHPLHGNKHSPQFPNVTKAKTLHKVDERILVSFIRSLSQIIGWSHPRCSTRRSSFVPFSGSETAESSKLPPRVLIEREKKNSSVCNHDSNHESTNHRTVLMRLKLFWSYFP